MIFGAEGVIGLVNLIMLLGGIATLVLLGLLVNYRYKRVQNNAQSYPTKLRSNKVVLLASLMGILALPAWVIGTQALLTYIEEKPERDAQTKNDNYVGAILQAMTKDDLTTFKQTLVDCGDYCIGQPNPSQRKYDNLLIDADRLKANRVAAYLTELNANEVPAPKDCSQRYLEGSVKLEDCFAKITVK